MFDGELAMSVKLLRYASKFVTCPIQELRLIVVTGLKGDTLSVHCIKADRPTIRMDAMIITERKKKGKEN